MPRPTARTTAKNAAPTVEALSHTYAVKSPLVTMVRSKFAPKSTPSRGPTAKPQYLPHPSTRPTYGAKRLPDAICRFSTMHWTDRPTVRPTDRRTDRPTDRSLESLIIIGRCAPRATRPKNGGLDQYDKVQSLNGLGGEMVTVIHNDRPFHYDRPKYRLEFRRSRRLDDDPLDNLDSLL